MVIELAREELFETTLDAIVVILPAREDDVVVAEEFVSVILEDREELLLLKLLCKLSIRSAADELFVFIVPLKETTDEFRDDDAE